jgi:hypothetical protein
MKSSPMFKHLEVTLIELEYALADFRGGTACLGETFGFVGLELSLVNLHSVTKRVLEAERAVQSIIHGQLESERLLTSTPA